MKMPRAVPKNLAFRFILINQYLVKSWILLKSKMRIEYCTYVCLLCLPSSISSTIPYHRHRKPGIRLNWRAKKLSMLTCSTFTGWANEIESCCNYNHDHDNATATLIHSYSFTPTLRVHICTYAYIHIFTYYIHKLKTDLFRQENWLLTAESCNWNLF